MEQNAQINTFTQGMDMDTDISLLGEGKYRYAENIRLFADSDSSTGALQNIEYIRQYSTGIPQNETIIGTSSTRWYHNDKVQECGIVVTKQNQGNKIYNKIYVVSDFDSITPTNTVVVKGYLELENNLSIVCNYESIEVSKIYITDANSTIKAINIQEPIEEEITDPTYFDLLPGCVLAPFKLLELVSGSLPSGMIQYCYQLFKTNGSETTTSSLSAKIPITNTANSTKGLNGSPENTLTNKGCRLQATAFNDGRFDRLRVISIQYLNSIDTPKIYIINEVDITSNDTGFITFEYTDTGSGYMSELTIDEFNDLVPFEFKAQVIEKKDNRLFAANIQEITWDVEYDARAYRANKEGIVRLRSSYGDDFVANQNDIVSGSTIVPKEHDCINPINGELLYPVEGSTEDYSWDTINDKLGGIGPNINYRFVYIEMTESEQTVDGSKLKYNLELNCNQKIRNIINVNDFETSSVVTSYSNTTSIARIDNYADPYFVANFLSYQRDEVYRFGIIFYNEKNIPTPVHWIADIRFPSADYLKRPFDQINNELNSRPIGLEFKVKNIPQKAISYEIVRCRRTLSDRTIVTQGLLSKTVNFRGWKDSSSYDSQISLGDIDRRPYVIPTFSTDPKFAEVIAVNPSTIEYKIVKDPVDTAGVFELITADTCFNKTQNLIEQGMYIVPLYVGCGNFSTTGNNLVNIDDFSHLAAVAPSALKGITNSTLRPCGLVVNHSVPVSQKVFMDGIDKVKNKESVLSALLLKFYKFYDKTIANNTNTNNRSARLIEDAKVATNISPRIASGLGDIKNNYIDYIGNYAYTNWSTGTGYGPHGITNILYSPQMYNTDVYDHSYIGIDKNSNESCGGSLFVNIKKQASQYGGNTFGSRQNSIYNISCCYIKSDFGNYNQNICFGGDTFLGVLDYTNTFLYQMNSFDDANYDKRFVQSYIPLESSVNVYYRSDKHFAQETTPSGIEGEGGTANILYMTEPGQLSTSYVQITPMYTYNSAYSNTNGSKNYIPVSMYAKDNQINNNRITCSEIKTNNELNDSWTKFKFANYLDVDSKYGQITNLKNFNNNLFFFQDEAVGVASVNERSLITDNNASQLVLGTGTILGRYDYQVVTNGSSVVNDKSIVNSSSTMYWYDTDKNTLCALNNTFMELSKSKGVQTYLNKLPQSAKTNVVSFYDKKYNEVWFRVYDKALIFNEQLNAFTSFYTHNPNWFFPFSDKLVTIKNNNMYYLHNIYEVNSDVKEERISKIQFVVNKDASNTKVFDNVSFDAKLLDNDNTTPQIVKEIVFTTKTQHTDKIDYNNIDNREDNYKFYIPRESQPDPATQQLVNKSYAGRMRGKYLICDYTFDCNSGREMKIPYIKTTYRYSMV